MFTMCRIVPVSRDKDMQIVDQSGTSGKGEETRECIFARIVFLNCHLDLASSIR